MSKPVFEDLFRFSGRRNRKSYALYLLVSLAIVAVVWAIALAFAFSGTGTGPELSAFVVPAIVSLAAAISGWAVASQRCRDFGWTGWAVLLTLIPAVGWIFALAILFIPGNVGPNRYGPDPIPNHLNDWTERAPTA